MEILTDYRYDKRHAIDGGEGQNSIGVFRAFDPQIQADIAVKEIAKHDFRDATEFFREAQQMFRSTAP